MKKIMLLGTMMLGIVSFTFAQTTTTASAAPAATATPAANNPNKSEFKFDKEVHDFGSVGEGPSAAYEFKFTNTGNEPLILTNVVASCGCTTPKWSREPVQKGKSGSILVSYDTNGRPGPFNKAVTISSNAKTPVKVLYIKGTVEKKKANS